MGGGKIFHGQFPDPPSWHEYFPSQTKTRSDDPLPPGRPLNGIPDTARFDWGPVDVPNEQMGDWKITDWAIEQLERDFDQPFFLAVGIFRPHLPWHVPRRYFDRYHPEAITLPTVNNNDLDDVPPIGVRMAGPDGDHQRVLQHKQWRKAVSAYLASISFADALRWAVARSPGPERSRPKHHRCALERPRVASGGENSTGKSLRSGRKQRALS